MSLAQVQLQGNLVKEPTVAYTEQGTAILKFTLAVNTGYKDKQIASFYDCALFGKQAEALGNLNITPGTGAVIAGEISIRKSTSDAGIKYTNVQVNVSSFNFTGKKGSGETSEENPDSVPF